MSADRKLRDLEADDIDNSNPLAIAAWCLSTAACLRRYGMGQRGAQRSLLSVACLILHGKVLANLDAASLEARLAELCPPDEIRAFFTDDEVNS